MNTSEAPKATRREWLGLAVIALPCLLYSMDLTVLYLAVPALSADLQPSSAQLLWILDIYGFLVAGSLITMGTLGDRIGRRRLLLIGAAAFGVISVLAAFSTSAEMLIATRALLGIAGATLAPSTLSLISNMFLDPKQRQFAIGIWAASFSAGAAIGPPLGGILLEYFWWGSVFLLAVPVMLLLLAVGPKLLPEFRDPAAGRIDIASAVLSLVIMLTVIYGLKRVAQDGIDLPAIMSVLIGIAAGVVFARRQNRLAEPLLDLSLFRVPAFSAALTTNTLGIFLAAGVFLFTGQYLQLVLGLSPLKAGLWSAPSAGGFIVGSMLAPVIAQRVRPVIVIASSLLLAAAGFVVIAQTDPGTGVLPIVSGSIIFAIGIAVVITLGTDMIVGTAPPERAGAASGISETGAELGGALGIAILGSIGAAVYRGQMADTIPAGVPPETASAAQGTIGGAVGAAEPLPEPLRVELLDAASDAFTQALQLTSVISAALALGVAIVAVLVLRNVRPGTGPDDQGDMEAVGAFADVATVDPGFNPAAAPGTAWD